MSNTYRPLIGLEIHVELKTKSKMFCQCDAEYFGKPPNSNTCPVCLGLPGALPVPNKQAVEWTIKIGKAFNCIINKITKFDRKHYFYPDLPKGYQISQYDEPIAVKGFIEANGKKFRIHRVHLEEDTGKLIHSRGESLVDFNRSSVPLVEIVTEADFDNEDDVVSFLKELHTIIQQYLDVSNADMDRGSMRMEPNISVRKPGEDGFPPYKVEVKNINSFNFVKKAIQYEIKRQTEILENGEIPVQETRGYNETKGITISQRVKEEAADYRYFPEPDIPPMVFEQKFIDSIEIPELPSQKLSRYVSEFKIKESDAFTLTRDGSIADFFEKVVGMTQKVAPQQIANLIVNKKLPVTPTVISEEEFVKRAEEQAAPKQTDSSVLDAAVKKVISANEKVVQDYKSGKENAIMFLVGQVMREMKGKADANVVKSRLIEFLTSSRA